VRTTLPEEYRTSATLCPILYFHSHLYHPPDFVPSEKFTKEWMEKMNINPSGFLWPEEHKLVLFLIKSKKQQIAWDPSERGNFGKNYFEPLSSRWLNTSLGLNKIFPYHQEYMMRSSK